MISISLESVQQAKDESQNAPSHITALAIMLHEIEEVNYHLQSSSWYDDKFGSPTYELEDHGEIPDRRAEKWLKLETGVDFKIS